MTYPEAIQLNFDAQVNLKLPPFYFETISEGWFYKIEKLLLPCFKFCILQFNETVCHFYCSRVDTQKLSNCRFVNDDTTYVYNDITKKLQLFEKNSVVEKVFNESPLLNQLEHFSTKFIADLPFAVKIHKILNLCSSS